MPAVVVGADANALGVVRSLGMAGIPTWVVERNRLLPAMQSRYARPFVVPAITGAGLVSGLLALREQLSTDPLLFLTHDLHVATVSRQRQALAGAYRIRLPPHCRVTQLLHKAEFQMLAERHGFAVPHSVIVSSEGDLKQLGRIRFPAVVKPASKEFFFTNKAPRARRVETLAEAVRLCRSVLLRAPDLIVQEWIEGQDHDIYFCLQYRGRGGELVASFTGRKLRCWPARIGNTLSCCAAAEWAPVLEPLTTAIFDAAECEGMCSVEFKRDARSGAFTIVEPTVGRSDWQEEIATLCGVNIPLAAYRHELGLTPPRPHRTPDQVIWRAPTCYWRSAVLTRSLDHVSADVRLVRAAWRIDDPAPLLAYWLEWSRRIVRRTFDRVAVAWLRAKPSQPDTRPEEV